jgi:hypothetical protein
MPNPYITQVPSYMQQDQQGLMPVFQNAAAQQQYMNQQLAQSNQLAQPQQLQRPQSSLGMNPLEMAKMLRQGGASPMDRAAAYLGTSNTPEMQAQVSQLGSNTYNPMSDYNMGTNGWGSFGE